MLLRGCDSCPSRCCFTSRVRPCTSVFGRSTMPPVSPQRDPSERTKRQIPQLTGGSELR
ncbi:hypothetical protein LDENG_00272360 [Lucifuga dentata]|nr:hypothetical protein LDENG_00272360 [Lucifuga dentata]